MRSDCLRSWVVGADRLPRARTLLCFRRGLWSSLSRVVRAAGDALAIGRTGATQHTKSSVGREALAEACDGTYNLGVWGSSRTFAQKLPKGISSSRSMRLTRASCGTSVCKSAARRSLLATSSKIIPTINMAQAAYSSALHMQDVHSMCNARIHIIQGSLLLRSTNQTRIAGLTSSSASCKLLLRIKRM